MSDADSRHPGSRRESKSLLPDGWRDLSPLVDAVLDAPPEGRAAVLDAVSAGDAKLRLAVERLVAECEREVQVLEQPAADVFSGLLLDDAEPAIPEVLGSRYRIEREVGRGGMARVYLARDLKHARAVAVKVIRPDLAASLGRDRFLREIEIAARLRHPNIVPLYDSGDVGNPRDSAGGRVLYFVMPYEEGPSLGDRLRRGEALTPGQCVSALRDIARALAYAHDQGVVHRDVKPDNVMMSGGAAVVTDFGIAKAFSASQTNAPSGTITQAGAGIGTPAYMAPEQAIGDPSTDHRADIYSFGCLAYELFTGHPPFHDLPTHQIVAAHVSTRPVALAEAAPRAPASVARLVDRCLEKNPAARPQSAQELVAELEGMPAEPNEPLRRRLTPLRALVFSVAAVLVLGVVSYVTYLGARGRTSPVDRPSELTLAVLPLSSRGADSVVNDMADGLSDEIAAALFSTPGLRVVSRGTVARYRGLRDIDPRKVGQELGARLLMTGVLRGTGNRFTVTANLVDTETGNNLWANVLGRDDGDFTAVREDIVREIQQAVQDKFGAPSPAPAAGQSTRTVDPGAYRDYLLGQAALSRRAQSIEASANLFRRATAKDSLFAKAWSGLSLALALAPYYQPRPTREVADEVTAAARRALQLDPSLAQPHIALGLIHEHAYQWTRAESELKTAVGMDARNVEARVQYGRFLVFQDRLHEALEQFLAARNEDPASAVVSSWVAYAYYLNGQLDSALVESDRAMQSDPSNFTTLGFGALIRLSAGDTVRARDYASRLPPSSVITLYVLAAVGDSAAVNQRRRAVDGKGRYLWMSETRRAFALLGARDSIEAIAALERATDATENWPTLQAVREHMFDAVRTNPRFHTLLQRVGIPLSVTRPLERR